MLTVVLCEWYIAQPAGHSESDQSSKNMWCLRSPEDHKQRASGQGDMQAAASQTVMPSSLGTYEVQGPAHLGWPKLIMLTWCCSLLCCCRQATS